MTAYHSILEDEKGQVEQIAFYNQRDDSRLGIGTKLSIVAPYYRIANDGKPIIRVDDTSSIFYIPTEYQNVCSYCGKGDSIPSKFKKCARCLRAFYCSKECQINDWKLLSHKLICFKD